MIRPALAALLLLAACAEQTAPGAPGPASRFEPGGAPPREVDMTRADADRLIGTWTGPYRPYDPTANELTGPVAGSATLTIDQVVGGLVRGTIAREHAAGDLPDQSYAGAFTISGHIMILNAHFIMFEQEGVRYIEADMQFPDGKFYRLRLVRSEPA